jgi:hypothetical protein
VGPTLSNEIEIDFQKIIIVADIDIKILGVPPWAGHAFLR